MKVRVCVYVLRSGGVLRGNNNMYAVKIHVKIHVNNDMYVCYVKIHVKIYMLYFNMYTYMLKYMTLQSPEITIKAWGVK